MNAWSNLKAKDECGCGHDECDAFGTLGKPDRAGRRHARGCNTDVCAVCRNKANKRNGSRRQAKALTAIGRPTSSLRPGNEETLGGAVRAEVKSGAQVNPILTRYLAAEAQSEHARPIGDPRPFVMVAMPDGVPWGLVLIRTDHLDDAVISLAEQRGLIP